MATLDFTVTLKRYGDSVMVPLPKWVKDQAGIEPDEDVPMIMRRTRDGWAFSFTTSARSATTENHLTVTPERTDG